MTELKNSARSMRLVTPAPAPEPLDVDTWLRQGMDNGFIGPPVCDIHDGTPTSADEDAAWDEDGEVCLPVLRLYDSPETKAAVEANHAPSVWRATNMK